MATAESKTMTVEEFLDLPDDGVRRALIDGNVMDLGMTVRRWKHGSLQSNVSFLLKLWVTERPEPRGTVVAGEAGFRLATGTLVGLDVAYVSPELAAATPESQAFYQGSPTIAVEILSPKDRLEDVEDKVETYLAAVVPHVWVIQPRFRTVTVYRPGAEPRMFTVNDEIATEPDLPGFRAPVRAIFEG